ncbi:cyclic nucleotide-binding domain-containing protein 1-like [Macrotis lagotis]|uniref:cyclic nucleotide-binding domain-containing protein 1-like n=1 Tax=Macrotis lagotis TaxID=92651 RepID=UPI003D68DEF4
MSQQWTLDLNCDTVLKPSKLIDYEQLEKLCEIQGLETSKSAKSTKEAHEAFMKHYKKIFQKEKRILPYLPKSSDKISSTEHFSVSTMDNDLHNIGFYIRSLHGQTSGELALQFKDKIEGFINVLRKL